MEGVRGTAVAAAEEEAVPCRPEQSDGVRACVRVVGVVLAEAEGQLFLGQ